MLLLFEAQKLQNTNTVISENRVEPRPLPSTQWGFFLKHIFLSSYSHPVLRIQPRSWQGSSVHTTASDSVIFILPATTFLCPTEDSQEPVDIRVIQQCILGDGLYHAQSAGACICCGPIHYSQVQYLHQSHSQEQKWDSDTTALDTQVCYSISSRSQGPSSTLAS